MEKEAFSKGIFKGKGISWEFIGKDPDIIELRSKVSERLEEKFREAYGNYINGDWAQAEDLLDKCLEIHNKDGPSIALKNFIQGENGTAPGNWKGCGVLYHK